MVRKKNKMFVDSADRTPHYSLRKLSVGVASVLLSTTLWMGANGSVAHADTNNDATVAVNAENPSETPMASKDQEQTQTAESTSQASVASAEKQNGEAQRGQVQEGSRANAGVQTATANDAHAQAGMTKQEPAAPSQQTASQAKVSAPVSAEEQASTAEQAAAVATEGQTNGSANADTDATTKAKKDLANPKAKSSDAAEDAKNESTTTLGVSQAFKPSTVAALKKKMVMASLAGTASAGSESKSDDLKSYETTITSLINRAHQDGLTVTKEKDETHTIKKEALDDLDKQVADIQGKVTKYEADKAAYDAAMKVYSQDMKKWENAQKSSDPHMVPGISQSLSFANEHDASLEVTSGSDKPVNFIKSSAWLGSKGEGVYADGITTGGNISKSFSDSDISHDQGEGTGKDIKDWGNTYTGVQLHVGESAVARYTGLKNSVYIDKYNVLHKLSKAQVKYTLNETTANDGTGTANIFLSNSPNIALWYGAAGGQSNGRVDLTVDLTFYDENGKEITLGKDSNVWLDMSSLNNGSTKIEYFDPKGNTTMRIPGSTIEQLGDDWQAKENNEVHPPAPAGWDNPNSADRYYGAAIMELEGNSFHIGQKITKYNPKLTDSRNVYSWFALDSRLATAYKPVEPKAPEKPDNIAWHEVIYK
ncbi:GbpC/Spa domain-containing protein, partial [Lactobacillus porci]|uniref:GbpC/Spa domain-containing protein n=1 Tax=Lactobacillus porci TaxID=2012477 RepID=UPI00399279D7